MGTISTPLPTVGGQRGDGEVAVRDALAALIAAINGNIDSANLKQAGLIQTLAAFQAAQLESDTDVFVAGAHGLTARPSAGASVDTTLKRDAPGVWRSNGPIATGGKSIIPATESRTNTAYVTLPTPDQVTVTLPTDGLIKVLFQATWQESVNGGASAALFVGSNQVKLAYTTAANPTAQSAALGFGTTGIDKALTTFGGGLLSLNGAGNATAYAGDVTTGQIVGLEDTSAAGSAQGQWGGPCYIFAAAGTYTVSVQFKASSGSVTAKNRKLWVAAEAY